MVYELVRRTAGAYQLTLFLFLNAAHPWPLRAFEGNRRTSSIA